MKRFFVALLGALMVSAAPAMAQQCVADGKGLTSDAIQASVAMDVLGQIGGIQGLTGKWVTEGGSFVFTTDAAKKVSVTYQIGKATATANVTKVCKLDATSLQVTAESKGKFYVVYLKITGNPTVIQLGFDPDDTLEFRKE